MQTNKSVPVEPPKFMPIFYAQWCCLTCGRVDSSWTSHVEQCPDCEAMAFNID